MCGKSGRISKIAGFFVILVNLSTLVFSIAMFLICLWMISSPSTLSSSIDILGYTTLKFLFPEESLTIQLGVAGAFLSGFFFFISAMGLYGAVTVSQFLLFMYAALVVLTLLLECAVIFYFTSNVMEKGLQNQDDIISHSIRLTLRCCDLNDIKHIQNFPWSCCEGVTKNCTNDTANNKNCKEEMATFLSKFETSIYITLGVIHIVLSSCSLVRRSCSASLSHS